MGFESAEGSRGEEMRGEERGRSWTLNPPHRRSERGEIEEEKSRRPQVYRCESAGGAEKRPGEQEEPQGGPERRYKEQKGEPKDPEQRRERETQE